MQTTCVRQGQIEIGIIEHEGREFSAFGATVQGDSITGYTRLVDGEVQLASWCGKTTLASRCEVVERFWSGSLALMFRLPRGRFIVGYKRVSRQRHTGGCGEPAFNTVVDSRRFEGRSGDADCREFHQFRVGGTSPPTGIYPHHLCQIACQIRKSRFDKTQVFTAFLT